MLEFLTFFAIVMIFEGMLPFASPQGWRKMILKISELTDKQLRQTGFFIMLSGLLLLWWVH